MLSFEERKPGLKDLVNENNKQRNTTQTNATHKKMIILELMLPLKYISLSLGRVPLSVVCSFYSIKLNWVQFDIDISAVLQALMLALGSGLLLLSKWLRIWTSVADRILIVAPKIRFSSAKFETILEHWKKDLEHWACALKVRSKIWNIKDGSYLQIRRECLLY